jgi:hypothetical protein
MILKYIYDKRAVLSAHKTEITHVLIILGACCVMGLIQLNQMGVFAEDKKYAVSGYEAATVTYSRPRESANTLHMILHITRDTGGALVLRATDPATFALANARVCLARSVSKVTDEQRFKVTHPKHCESAAMQSDTTVWKDQEINWSQQ